MDQMRPGYLCEQCLDAPAVAFVPAPWGGEMGICADCGGLEPAATLAVPTGACARHPLARAHSPLPSRHGTMVYVTCGVCGVRGMTTAALWQAEQARRRGAGTSAAHDREA